MALPANAERFPRPEAVWVKTASILLLTFLTALPALAVDVERLERRATDPETGPLPPGWMVGPGMVFESGTYSSGNSSFTPVPTLYFRNDRCDIYLKTAGCRLLERGRFELDAVAELRLDGFAPADDRMLSGMEEREPTIDVGLEMAMTTPVGIFEVEALQDPLGRHGGRELTLSWNAPLVLKRSVIQLSLGYSWKSAELADYYYGVRPEEARPGRPAYEVGATETWSVGVEGSQRISRRTMLLYSLKYERFSSAIRNSPIVDEEGQLRAFTGFGWRF